MPADLVADLLDHPMSGIATALGSARGEQADDLSFEPGLARAYERLNRNAAPGRAAPRYFQQPTKDFLHDPPDFV